MLKTLGLNVVTHCDQRRESEQQFARKTVPEAAGFVDDDDIKISPQAPRSRQPNRIKERLGECGGPIAQDVAIKAESYTMAAHFERLGDAV